MMKLPGEATHQFGEGDTLPVGTKVPPRAWAPALAGLLLTACATPSEPRIVVKEVAVPVARACVPKDFRDPPGTPDSDEAVRAAAGPGEMLQLLAAGRLLYRQWISEAIPIIRSCR